MESLWEKKDVTSVQCKKTWDRLAMYIDRVYKIYYSLNHNLYTVRSEKCSQPLHSQIWRMLTTSTQSDLGLQKNSQFSQAPILTSEKWSEALQGQNWAKAHRLYTVRSELWDLTSSHRLQFSHLRKAHRLYTVTSEKSSQTLHSQIWVCLSFSSQIRLCSLSHISLWTLSLWSGVQQRCTLSAEISREKTHTEKWTRPAKSYPPDYRTTCLADKNKSSSRKAESQ